MQGVSSKWSSFKMKGVNNFEREDLPIAQSIKNKALSKQKSGNIGPQQFKLEDL